VYLLRGEAQAKSGKKEQTQGHLKKISDMQWQIRQTTKDIARLWICMNTCRKFPTLIKKATTNIKSSTANHWNTHLSSLSVQCKLTGAVNLE